MQADNFSRGEMMTEPIEELDDIRDEDCEVEEEDESRGVTPMDTFPAMPGLVAPAYLSKALRDSYGALQAVKVKQYSERMEKTTPSRTYAARENVCNLGMGKDRPGYPQHRAIRKRKLL